MAEDSCSGMRRDAVLVQSNQTRGEPPLVREESDKCGIIVESGEDEAWGEAWESLWARG